MSFEEILKHLKAGKRARFAGWSRGRYIKLGARPGTLIDQFGYEYSVTAADLACDRWELVECNKKFNALLGQLDAFTKQNKQCGIPNSIERLFLLFGAFISDKDSEVGLAFCSCLFDLAGIDAWEDNDREYLKLHLMMLEGEEIAIPALAYKLAQFSIIYDERDEQQGTFNLACELAASVFVMANWSNDTTEQTENE